MVSKSKFSLLSVIGLIFSFSLALGDDGARYNYEINLVDIQKNRFEVMLNCEGFASDTLIYYFPWIIQGTYMEANYGRQIHKLIAYDQDGQRIKVKKRGKNTYIITPANEIKSIQYWVSATWDSRRRGTIWPMAGTGIIPDRIFAINAGGVFGYFKDEETSPVDMHYTYPKHLYAMTELDQTLHAAGRTSISTRDYHELIDSPILFAAPDTTHFKVHNTDVLVGFAHEYDDTPRASEITQALEPSMQAIGAYIDSLPADEYAYLIYYNDARALGKILHNPRFMIIKGFWYFLRHGLPMGGALEHNKSSFYYMPDPGMHYTESVNESIKDISIHEFMHILTPLNLSSQHIHNWDYNEPILSEHLWLYEGVTEYMSQIIQVNGDLKTPKEFLAGSMRSKIRKGEKFPLEEMSFTEMARGVLERPFKKEYLHVYDRGAVMGMLLDIEIIRLTEGRKRLIDVMLELIDEYGVRKPMDEDRIFDLFTEKVHPDLRNFFSKHIEGREALPYDQILSHVGVKYEHDIEANIPQHPLKGGGVKTAGFSLGSHHTIKKVKKSSAIDFKAGDKVDHQIYLDTYFDDFGSPLPEGMVVSFPVERDGQEVNLNDTIKYNTGTLKHSLTILKEMTPEQSRYFNIWLGFEDPGEPAAAKFGN